MDHFRMKRPFQFCLVLFISLLLTQTSLAGEDSGSLGIQVVPLSTGELSVLHVIDGSPAKQVGLLPGDLIIAVDGQSMQGSDFELVTRNSLWGRVGTSVSLVWLRPGVVGTMEATLNRVPISADIQLKLTPGVTIKLPK
jgi:carboxyl-terminal processing protease